MLKEVGDGVGAFVGNLHDLEPSSCGIDHGKTMKCHFSLWLVGISNCVRAYQVYTDSSPRDGFHSLLGKFAELEDSFLVELARGTSSAHVLNSCSHSRPVVMLGHSELCSSLTRVHEQLMVPFDCSLLKVFWEDYASIVGDEIKGFAPMFECSHFVLVGSRCSIGLELGITRLRVCDIFVQKWVCGRGKQHLIVFSSEAFGHLVETVLFLNFSCRRHI